jgi:phosphatidylglycerol---prolipoprotein diacylglyceryl transferase
MFIHNINPILVSVGPISIRYYGLIYALGFVLAYVLLKYFVKHGRIKNMKSADVDDFMVWLVFGVVVGARVFDYLFFSWPAIITDPLGIVRIWEGGLSFHGGLIGAVLVTLLFCKKKSITFYDIADMLVIPAALGLFFGRLANFINGELWGTITNVPWCVKFPGVDGCRHPSQLYEALKNLFIFFTLIFLYNKREYEKHGKGGFDKMLRTPGFLFWTFWLLYGLLRFIVNFWRDDARWLGLSLGQYLSFAMFIVAAFMLYRIGKKNA